MSTEMHLTAFFLYLSKAFVVCSCLPSVWELSPCQAKLLRHLAARMESCKASRSLPGFPDLRDATLCPKSEQL